MDPQLISGSEAVKWSLPGPDVACVQYVVCVTSYPRAVGAGDGQQLCAGDDGRNQRTAKDLGRCHSLHGPADSFQEK